MKYHNASVNTGKKFSNRLLCHVFLLHVHQNRNGLSVAGKWERKWDVIFKLSILQHLRDIALYLCTNLSVIPSKVWMTLHYQMTSFSIPISMVTTIILIRSKGFVISPQFITLLIYMYICKYIIAFSNHFVSLLKLVQLPQKISILF